MADKQRGALNAIKWEEQKMFTSPQAVPKKADTSKTEDKSNKQPHVHRNHLESNNNLNTSLDNIVLPVNQYPSVVAPVKGNKENRKSSNDVKRRRNSDSDHEVDDAIKFYVGYLGYLQVTNTGTGIGAIQKPMSDLYFPYRKGVVVAQERLLRISDEGLQVIFIEDMHSEEPTILLIKWADIVYAEPLRFSTKSLKDKKVVHGLFEPSEAERNALLQNKESLFFPLGKEEKFISKLVHPALFTTVIRNANGIKALCAHAYVCSTVEESVFLARTVRAKIDKAGRGAAAKYGHSDRSIQSTVPYDVILNPEQYQSDPVDTVFEDFTFKTSAGPFAADKNIKEKPKDKHKSLFGKKKSSSESFNEITGSQESAADTFHFGMATSAPASPEEDEINRAFHENFVIGKPPPKSGRNKSSQERSSYRDLESEFSFEAPSRDQSSNEISPKPVAFVQPQVTNLRDAYRVLPSSVSASRQDLKPTVIQVKNKDYTEITPELDEKLRKRQSDLESSLLVPRSVINPLADIGQSQVWSTSNVPKGKTAIPWKTTPALPESAWNEPVINNFYKKEAVTSKLLSESVDKKQLPRLKREKKELEMANLFNDTRVDEREQPPEVGISGLEASLGYLP